MNASVNLKSVDEYLYGYVFIELFHLANKYNVFQYLIDNQRGTLDDMTATLSLNPDPLQRLLISLSAANILLYQQQVFTINPQCSHFFDRKNDGYIGDLIHFIRDQGRAALQQLEGHLTNKTLTSSPYDTMYDAPTDTNQFTLAMWQLSYSTGKGLAAYMPENCGHIVDIGGGSGALAAAFVQAGVSQHIEVFDLPAVRPDFDSKMAEYQLAGQIHLTVGDFFIDPLPDADTYLLSYVLSNWADLQIIALLKRLATKLPAKNGQLIVFERLFFDDGINPLPTAIMHLNMMLHTKGKHRTADEYRKLFLAGGFGKLKIISTPYDKQLLIASQ